MLLNNEVWPVGLSFRGKEDRMPFPGFPLHQPPSFFAILPAPPLQLPSGLLVNGINARKLLMAGVILWSAATALAPAALNLARDPNTAALALPVSVNQCGVRPPPSRPLH